MTTRVLAATDFSEGAAVGLHWAALLARSLDATLHLVHGIPPLPPVADYTAPPPDLGPQLVAAASERLEELANRWREEGLAVACHAEMGRPFRVVLDLAERLGAALIVLGTRGHTGLARLLLGSTADRVIRLASCPVLAVHPEDGRPGELPRLVLAPTDFSPGAQLACEQALRLFRLERDGSRVLLLHAWHLPGDYALYDYGGAPSFAAHREEAMVSANRLLAEGAAAVARRGVAVETLLREGSAPDLIARLAAERGVGLIAMGTHGLSGIERLLIGSTAEQVVYRAPCPVLTVRLPAEAGRAGE